MAWLMAGALILRLFVAWADYGFVATDDHNHVLVDAVPAQRVPGAGSVVEKSGVRSPVPRLFIYQLGQTAFRLGLEDPISQIRWIYAVLGALSLLSVWAVWRLYEGVGQTEWGTHAVVWSGFHFLAVFLSTRALIENMAAPYLTLSAVFLVFYWRRHRVAWLLGSLLALAIGSMFRFQVGIAVLVLIAAPIVKRAWRDVALLGVTGIGLFVLTGWPDYVLRGSFHASLGEYLIHNLRYSSVYGVSAWYNYLLLLLAASLPPLLLARYQDFPWKSYARLLWPVIAMVSVFVIAHTAAPHKEDRFMLPILPLYLALLAPFSAHLFARRPRSWRTYGFCTINAALILLIAASPTQNNIIGLVRYLGEHPSIEEVRSLGDSLEVYPTAYSERAPTPVHRVNFIPVRAAQHAGCSVAIAVRDDLLMGRSFEIEGLRQVAVFEPGVLERILTVTNPGRNARRSALRLFLPEGCSEGF